MKILTEGGYTLNVDDGFADLPPDQQRTIAQQMEAKAAAGAQSGFAGGDEPTAFQRGDYKTGPAQNLPQQPWSGSVLPVSTDSEGNVKFDPNAGILGGLIKTFKTPGDVYQGNIDLNTKEGFGQALQMGAAINPMGPVGAIAPRAAVAPSREALKDAASSAYDAVRDSGVTYNPVAVGQRMDAMKGVLERTMGIDRDTSPKSFGALDTLERRISEKPQANIDDIEIARRKLDAAAKDFNNPTDQKTAGILKKGLEGFISDPPSNAVPEGKFDDAIRAAGLMKEARGNYGAASRAELLDKLQRKADFQAETANSGLNVDNAIRRKAANLLENEGKIRGFSDEEKAALKEVASGTPSRNALRWIGNYLGGGGGYGAYAASAGSAGLGFATGGPSGAALGAIVPPAIGLLAKSRANASTRNALQAANEMVRQRSPMYEGILAQQSPIPLPDYFRLGFPLLSQSPWRQR